MRVVSEPVGSACRPVVAFLTIVVGVLVSACGILPNADGSGGSKAGPASELSQDFTIVADGSNKRVIGHGFTFVVPGDWAEYAPETTIYGGTSREWAVQASAPKDPFVPYLSISAAFRPGKQNSVANALALFKGVQQLNKNFHLLDESDVDVPGARTAHLLQFNDESDVKLPGDETETHVVFDTRSLFINMPGGELTIVRFIAPKGHAQDGHFDEIQKSLVVHVGKPSPSS